MNKYIYRLQHVVASVIGNISNRPRIDACWANKELNAGDLVTPMLLRRYGFTPVFSYRNEAVLFSCGSLLDKVPEDFSGFILGTGLMRGDVVKSFPHARILAVRGEMTRNNIAAPKGTILGDPGLLVAKSMTKKHPKRYVLGLIPHFTEKQNPTVHRLLSRYKQEIIFIDIQTNPLAVLELIDQCEYILSSSLHGMVFADSLGVPNLWTILSDRVSGKGFKFHDYLSALNWEREPVPISGDERLSELISRASLPPLSVIEEAKNHLDEAYRLMKQEFQSRK
jgi:pyruvyltransferase